MNLATVFFCICILHTLTIYHVTVAGQVAMPPMAIVVYTDYSGRTNTKYTDLTVAKATNLSLPFHELKYIAILCPSPTQQTNAADDTFIVLDVIRKIDANTKYPMCERYLKPFILNNPLEQSTFYINFKYGGRKDHRRSSEVPKSSTDKAETKDKKWNMYTDFIDSIRVDEKDHAEATYLWINYDFDLMMPSHGAHFVTAHMHSNDYEEECQEMQLGITLFENKIKNFNENTFNEFSAKHPNFSWHQLIPRQDFKGVYTTSATCTYLNYVLLHKRVIEGPLKNLEILIRDISDVMGTVIVHTGVYKEKRPDSTPNSKQDTFSIPTILWKRISYVNTTGDENSILMVIHNQRYQRVCERDTTDEVRGWPVVRGQEESGSSDGNVEEPEHDDNKEEKEDNEEEEEEDEEEEDEDENEEIGAMYYCVVDKTIAKKLLIPEIKFPSDATEMLPFDLEDITEHIDVLNAIKIQKEIGGVEE